MTNAQATNIKDQVKDPMGRSRQLYNQMESREREAAKGVTRVLGFKF